MSKPKRGLEKQIHDLHTTLREGPADRQNAAILKTLKQKNGVLIAIAAGHCEKVATAKYIQPLNKAFVTLCSDGVKRDPTCRGKVAILKALRTLEAQSADVFLLGVRYHQWEKAWGPPEDTAGEVRGQCGAALGEMRHPDAIYALTLLLADPNIRVRNSAAESLGDIGRQEAIPLLYFKALSGDSEPEVLANVMRSLFHLAGDDAMPWISPLLEAPSVPRSRDVVLPMGQSDVALAMGQSRLLSALKPLCKALHTCRDPEVRQNLMTAIALLRRDEAFEVLEDIITDGMTEDANMALEALGIYHFDTALGARLLEHVVERGDDAMEGRVRKTFSLMT